MTQPSGTHRVCPTRTDGRAVLFAHKVSSAQCQDRQRGRYHKCFTCVHNNAWVAANGTRPVRAPQAAVPAVEAESAEGEEAELAASRG